jgi:hypothetical protein
MTGRDLIEWIVERHLGGEVVSAEPVTGGYSGARVHRVRARLPGGERELVLKTARAKDEPERGDEQRIYGTHPGSLGAVHALLRARGLPTYDLLGWGMPSDELPLFWAAMSALGGVSVRDRRDGLDAEGFHRTCGAALGALHAVTRGYDGVVDLAKPHARDWDEAFFGSFERAVERELGARGMDDLAARVQAFAERRRRDWAKAGRYALSHVDGLQGHAARSDAGWRYLGHVDLEDVVFLDARFALAGYELGAGGPAPPAFWDAYREFAAVDQSYAEVSDVMTLYFLVSWLWIESGREQIVGAIRRVLHGR